MPDKPKTVALESVEDQILIVEDGNPDGWTEINQDALINTRDWA